MRSILYILIVGTFFNSCSKSFDRLKEGTAELSLHECAKGVISGDNLRLCFDKVISDSRCPANAMCVWQGTAVARFSFTQNGKVNSFDLSTLDMAPTYNQDTTISGYKIEFINLSPYPGTYTPPIPDSQIKAELKITKQ